MYTFLYMCKHDTISQKYEEHESKDFHVCTMNSHYTLRVVLSLGKGQGTEIQVTGKGILAKSKIFPF